MRIVSDYKIVNVRVSAPTFGYIKVNAPFVEKNIPSLFGQTESLFKDRIAICHDYDIEKMMKDIEKRSYMHVPNRITSVMDAVTKKELECQAELSKLLSYMKNNKFTFANIMEEME